MDTATGEVNNLQMRTQTGASDIWTFRLERFDREGNRLKPIPVEMRGVIEGFMSDGDRATAYGSWQGGVLSAKRVYNITTDSDVRVKSYAWVGFLMIAVFILVLVVIVIAAMD